MSPWTSAYSGYKLCTFAADVSSDSRRFELTAGTNKELDPIQVADGFPNPVQSVLSFLNMNRIALLPIVSQ